MQGPCLLLRFLDTSMQWLCLVQLLTSATISYINGNLGGGILCTVSYVYGGFFSMKLDRSQRVLSGVDFLVDSTRCVQHTGSLPEALTAPAWVVGAVANLCLRLRASNLFNK